MDRSRSKRSHYYDQEYESQVISRTKARYHHHYNHRRALGGRPSKSQESAASATISYRILCPDVKAGGVIGKSGSIIKAFRQETGALISIHPLVPGDDERIIEISDSRRRDSDARLSPYSPAQEALLMIHERIIECDPLFDGSDNEDDYGPRGPAARLSDIATRLLVPRSIVGCLLGKGGKIIEHMRAETRTHIRILPRDHKLPRCVSVSEEIVQVVGTTNAVKKAIIVISSRLKEAMLRDRVPFYGRLQPADYYFSPDDDLSLPMHGMKSPFDVSPSGQRSTGRYTPHPPGYGFESTASIMTEMFPCEELIFQILCPSNKVEYIVGESHGIMDMLCSDIGVDVKVTDPIPGSDESIIIVSSEEGPDDEMFPAQEALLHIQSRIVDLAPDKDNIITTRLLVPADFLACLDGRDERLSEMGRSNGANIQVLPREILPPCAVGVDELVQIVGEIRAAREALILITSKLRSYLYREFSSQNDLLLQSDSSRSLTSGGFNVEAIISPSGNTTREGYQVNETLYQNIPVAAIARPVKDAVRVGNGYMEEEKIAEEGSSLPTRLRAPFVTKSTLEVIIPEHAVASLSTRSNSKLVLISEMSGATVSFVENGPDRHEKVIKISGTPEQAERAQSLLQGFILSTQEDERG